MDRGTGVKERTQNQLAAANTMFQPKRNKSVCTFLQTESTGSEKVNDFGKYVGRKVKAKHDGTWIPGVVEKTHTNNKGHMRWSLRFEDGHVMQTDEKHLQNMLVYERRKQIGRQLDYVLVSKRWLSSIENRKLQGLLGTGDTQRPARTQKRPCFLYSPAGGTGEYERIRQP